MLSPQGKRLKTDDCQTAPKAMHRRLRASEVDQGLRESGWGLLGSSSAPAHSLLPPTDFWKKKAEETSSERRQTVKVTGNGGSPHLHFLLPRWPRSVSSLPPPLIFDVPERPKPSPFAWRRTTKPYGPPCSTLFLRSACCGERSARSSLVQSLRT